VTGSSLALPRRWVAGLLACVLLAVAAVVVVVLRTHHGSTRCGATAVQHPRDPLLSVAQMAARPDARLDRLTAAVDAMPAPVGQVRAGVGFDYDQYLHAYGVAGGVLTWTKNNAPVTYLDETSLTPRWSLRPASRRTAWDASKDRFLLLDLGASTGTRVSSYGLSEGRKVWCTDLGLHQVDGDPVATTFLDGGDVLVALRSAHGDGITLTRLRGTSGGRVWQHTLAGADRADFLGELEPGTALVGGSEEYRLAASLPTSAPATAISALDTTDGHAIWSWGAGAGSLVHVVGVADGRVVVSVRSTTGTELVALDGQDGSVLWRATPPALAYEATLRGDVVVVRSPAGLDAYAATDGTLRWHYATPSDRTFFPYGFTLGQMPSLDADHVLVPTTTSLLVLDLRNASTTTLPLPVDGISTTFWPYQLLATDHLVGVVTNTGAVLAARE
jgi:outer membrane protein assembly factor BamB